MSQKSQSNSNASLIQGISITDTKKLLDAYEEHGQLFLFKYLDMSFVYRSLISSELDTIQKLTPILNTDGVDEWIVDRTLVWASRDPYTLVYGLMSTLSEKIIHSSTLTESRYKSLIDEYRAKASTLDNVINTTIIKAYPTVDVRKLDMNTKVKLQSLAEQALNTQILFGDDANKKGPKVPKGFSSISKSEILSKERADKPDFERDNRELGSI